MRKTLFYPLVIGVVILGAFAAFKLATKKFLQPPSIPVREITVTASPEVTSKPRVPGYITGKVVIDYEAIKQFPMVEDELNIMVSKAKGSAEFFGITLCKQEKTNCVWLISQTEKTRTYGYKIDEDGDADPIYATGQYIINTVSRIYVTTEGNVGDARSQLQVTVPDSGILKQDFSIVATAFK